MRSRYPQHLTTHLTRRPQRASHQSCVLRCEFSFAAGGGLIRALCVLLVVACTQQRLVLETWLWYKAFLSLGVMRQEHNVGGNYGIRKFLC